MLQQYLLNILITVIAVDLVIAGILVVFIINTRINLKREFIERRFEIKAIKVAQRSKSSEEAGRELGMSTEEFKDFCQRRSILTPEIRIAKKEEAEKRKQEELRKIIEEEATWRAEQERMAEELRKEQEEESRKRKDRLRKFGIS